MALLVAETRNKSALLPVFWCRHETTQGSMKDDDFPPTPLLATPKKAKKGIALHCVSKNTKNKSGRVQHSESGFFLHHDNHNRKNIIFHTKIIHTENIFLLDRLFSSFVR